MRLKTIFFSFSIIYLLNHSAKCCIALSIKYKQNSAPSEDIRPYQNGVHKNFSIKDRGITGMNDIHLSQLTLTTGNGKVPDQVAYSVHLIR